MSTLKATNIKNDSSASNNIVLDSGGGVVVSGILTATTFSGNVSGNITIGAGSTSAPSLAPSGDSNTGVFFPSADTIAFAEGGAEVARFDSSGRFLVGTTTARSNFFNTTISSGFQFEGAGGSNPPGQFSSLTYGSSNDAPPYLVLAKHRSDSVGGTTVVQSGDGLGTISFQGSDGSEFILGARIDGVVDGTPGANDMPGRLVFSTTADGASSPTERMRISAKGDILTGSTSTWGAADSGASFYIHNNSDQQTLKISNGDPGSSPYGLVGFYRNKGSVIARITTDGSTVSYNTSSDYRLKENITLLTNATDRLKQIPVHRFNFIADPGKTVDGFIAHEVQEIVPEAINGEKDGIDSDGNPVYQGIDQSKLVPLLTAALQEAIAKIETLEAQNAAILARLDAAGL